MRPTFNELNTINHASFHLHDNDQVLEKLEPIIRLIRRGKQLPVRKLSFNIRKLSDGNPKTGSHDEPRWARLQNLGCETAVLCMIAFNSLATLAGDEFEWLLENVQRYLAIQSLPCGWIASEQIRQVMARALRQPNTLSFLESYHKHEFQISDNKEQHVRKRTGDETQMKYMFSNAPAGIISTLPEPFKKAVENSQLWKWERKHRLTKTGCLGTLFPRDEMQDVSLTI
ncbi:hypothetical protein BDBG_07457 [Blastomyces gilchristii SLH14081]|uniref:Uncharacterized protein n=1 Tax=Blastomyces gilchristii (strain SLH14081) TaxID=559298 RepID=A0A179V0C7_BLAGS|nr:uncharacterized protein BDBG_07457 [Blastomyces gilchristii SLH14081]OAT12062.1 hypothetical protein BDBG_07457 [Blastomyces gilchristii SLH14081]